MKYVRNLFGSKQVKVTLVVVLALVLAGGISMLKAEKKVEKPVTEEVKKDSGSGKGFLGVVTRDLSSDEKKEAGVVFGIEVRKVEKGEAAEKAGIQKGDIIQYYNNEKIRDQEDLINAVRESKPGIPTKIKISREGKEKELTVTPGELKTRVYTFGDGNLEKDGNVFMWKGETGGYLGVSLQTIQEKELAEYFGIKENEGALILSVEKDSPAQTAGLKPGDVIVKIDGKAVSSPSDVSKIISKMKKGDKTDLEVMRHSKSMTVKAELAERKTFGNFNINIPDIKIPEMNLEHLKSLKGNFHVFMHDNEDGGSCVSMKSKCCPKGNHENMDCKKEGCMVFTSPKGEGERVIVIRKNIDDAREEIKRVKEQIEKYKIEVKTEKDKNNEKDTDKDKKVEKKVKIIVNDPSKI